ncbi:MAG: shikimate kinase [Phormidesmis sp.]
MPSDIILIGPISAGKSTIGKLLAEQLKLPQCSMDECRWDYYKEIGYDKKLAEQKRKEGGFWEIYQYWKPFEAYAVQRLLSDTQSDSQQYVIDLGAGHSVYEDSALFQSVERVLQPYPNVVLLLPSPDLDKSVRILNVRNGYALGNGPNIDEHFVMHPSNARLAKLTIYTAGKTPEQICSEILRQMSVA